MKKNLAATLAFALTLGVAGTAFADSNPFVDVPTGNWAYGAVTKLAQDGIVDGYGDKTFQGNKAITRYEMAQVVAKAVIKLDKANEEDKALLKKLYAEYKDELKSMNVRVSALESDVKDLQAKVGNVKLTGLVRGKYDSDRLDGENWNSGNKHFYMDLEGQMKVNDRWDAHFQSETNKQYTGRTWNNAHTGQDTDGDGTFQRIWAEGSIGKVGVVAGRKFWALGPQTLVFGHGGDGISLNVPLSDSVNASLFNIRPAQSGVLTRAFSDPYDTAIYGLQLNANLTKDLNADVFIGGNRKSIDGPRTDGLKEVTGFSGVDLVYKFSKDWKLTGSYTRTNADDYNNDHEFRIDYKGTDLSKPGSYGVFARFFKFQLQGTLPDDEWATFHGDSKGWVLGADYVLAQNIQWTTFYSEQKLNNSGLGLIDSTDKDAKRKLLRTQVDLHF